MMIMVIRKKIMLIKRNITLLLNIMLKLNINKIIQTSIMRTIRLQLKIMSRLLKMEIKNELFHDKL